MIWFQALACFGLWIGYGVVQARRSESIRAKVNALPRGTRATLGAVLLVVGAAVLFGTLIGAQLLGGFTRDGMSPLTWLAIGAGGLLFVHAQTMAMAMLVSLVHESVTSTTSPSSDQEIPQL